MTDARSFAALLKRARLAAGLTQEALAERAGLSAKTVSDLERDASRLPRLETVALVAAALCLPTDGRERLLTAARPDATPPELGGADQSPSAPASRLPPTTIRLPQHPTPLIGREKDIVAVRALVLDRGTRLFTLAGPGGVGKTRLALAVAERVAPAFGDGVVFVDLAPLRDAAKVPQAIALALGLSDRSNEPPLARLRDVLHDQELLLLLDNFEHVLEATADVAALLRDTLRLTILCTSRVLLHLAGEQVYPVPVLALPEPICHQPTDELAEVASVALFLARARARSPDFQLTGANAGEVATICARLDGLPLAIELAAARTAVLSPRMLLERLDRRFTLLTDGPNDMPERQRTLRAAIAWSYDLLDERERVLLEYMAVFAGGWTLEAAEAICTAGAVAGDVVGMLHGLIDKHLARRAGNDGRSRYAMLETIREYALEQLAERGELSAARHAHALYVQAFAERAEPLLHGPEQAAWFDLLDDELANIRVALAWLLADGAGVEARRLAWAMHWFWHVRGHLTEGRDWLDRALHAGDSPSPLEQARLHYAAGLLAVAQGDLQASKAHLEIAFSLWSELAAAGEGEAGRYQLRSMGQLMRTLGVLGDPAIVTRVSEGLALARSVDDDLVSAEMYFGYARGLIAGRGDEALARRVLLESQETFREQGDIWYLTQVTIDLGVLAMLAEDSAEARRYFHEALAAARELRDQALEATAYNNLGEVARLSGDDGEAAAYYDRGLALFRAMGAQTEVPRLVHNRAYLALHALDAVRAGVEFCESLNQFRAIGQEQGMVEAVAGLAAVDAYEVTAAAAARAARLWAAADAAHRAGGTHAWPVDQAERDRYELIARAAAGDSAFDAAYATGRSLSLIDAITEAISRTPMP